MSGSGISWAIRKSTPRSRQITTPAPHHLVFYRLDALPAAQPTVSEHWRHTCCKYAGRLFHNELPQLTTQMKTGLSVVSSYVVQSRSGGCSRVLAWHQCRATPCLSSLRSATHCCRPHLLSRSNLGQGRRTQQQITCCRLERQVNSVLVKLLHYFANVACFLMLMLAMHIRCGGIFNKYFAANLRESLTVKYFQNLLRNNRVTTISLVSFFWNTGVYWSYIDWYTQPNPRNAIFFHAASCKSGFVGYT